METTDIKEIRQTMREAKRAIINLMNTLEDIPWFRPELGYEHVLEDLLRLRGHLECMEHHNIKFPSDEK